MGGFVQRFAALWIDNLVIAAITGALLGTMWVTGILLGYLVAGPNHSLQVSHWAGSSPK